MICKKCGGNGFIQPDDSDDEFIVDCCCDGGWIWEPKLEDQSESLEWPEYQEIQESLWETPLM